jgi:predicted transcriptional regulator
MPARPRRHFGELEARVLATLWAASGPLSVQEVLDRLDGDVVYTTVAKVLDRLHGKGSVTRTMVGRAFAYTAVPTEANFVAAQVRGLLGRAGSRQAALQGLVDGLDPADTDRLALLLQQALRQRERQQ